VIAREKEPAETLVAAIYSRISTAQQKEGISLTDQIERMRAYAAMHEIDVPLQYQFQEVYSGLKEARPEYEKVRELIRKRKITALIVYSSDRHTRDEIHGEIFDEEMRRSQCELHIVTRGGKVDIYSPNGRLLNTIERAFNKHWAMMIKQTVMDKKRAYAEAGIPALQGETKFGYRRVGRRLETRLEIIEEEAAVVRQIFDWADAGLPTFQIVKRLIESKIPTPAEWRGKRKGNRRAAPGKWCREYLHSLMRDEIYAGIYYAYRYETVDGVIRKRPREEWIAIPVPAIVSREQWERVQNFLDTRRTLGHKGHSKYEYLMARLCKCHRCGLSIFGERRVSYGKTKGKKKYYTFYYRCKSSQPISAAENCKLKHAKVGNVDDTIWQFTKTLLEDPRFMIDVMKEAQEEQSRGNMLLSERIDTIDKLVTEAQAEIDQLYLDFKGTKSGKVRELIEQDIERTQTKVDGLLSEREKLAGQVQEQNITDEEIAVLEAFAEKVKHRLPHATFQDKRDIIEALKLRFELDFEEGEHVIYVNLYARQFKLFLGEEVISFVELIGYLGAAPDHRLLPSGVGVCSFNVATKRIAGRNDEGERGYETDWCSVEAWDKLAERCVAFLHKGSRVRIVGTLQSRSWEDKESGQRRYKTVVRANDVLFLDARSDEGEVEIEVEAVEEV
jgi:single stranded DNA-binding protein